MTRLAESYYCYSCSRGTSFSESFHRYKEGEIPTRKGKYTVIRTRTNTKPQQLIKNIKIPCITCITQIFVHHLPKWSKLEVRQIRSTPGTLKNTSGVSLLLFVGNPHFNILLHRVRYLKNLFVSQR